MLNTLLFLTLAFAPLIVLLGFALLPARWNKVFLLVAGIGVLLAWSVFPGNRDEWLPVSLLIKLIQIILMVLAIGVGASIRWLWSLWRRGAVGVGEPTLHSEWPRAVFGGILGFFVPGFIAFHGVFGRADGTLTLSVVILIALFLIAISVALYRSGSRAQLLLPASCAASFSAVILFAFWTGSLVQAAAYTAAQGNPYCIQSGNRPVSQTQELTFLTLRAPKSSEVYLNYHGLLVVKEKEALRYYNWSYFRRSFLPAKMVYKPDALCVPLSH
jgi:hypothetical protein